MHNFPSKSTTSFKMFSAMQTNSSQINSSLSLYIPHVFPNFTTEYIADVFDTLGLGRVDHIDLVAKQDKNGKNYNAAYVHFAEWFKGPATEHFQERVINPDKEARIIHDEPWYWIVLENKTKKYEPGARKLTLDLEEPIKIAQGLSEFETTPEYDDEIDALISELNDPIDASCEFDKYVDEQLIKMQEENKLLKEINQILDESLKREREYCNSYRNFVSQLEQKVLDLNAEKNALCIEVNHLHQGLYIKSKELEDAELDHEYTRQELLTTEMLVEQLDSNEPDGYELCCHCNTWFKDGLDMCECGKCDTSYDY